MKRIVTDIDDKKHAKFKIATINNGTSMSVEIERFVDVYIKTKNPNENIFIPLEEKVLTKRK
jgi:hypothetical protein